MAKAPAPAVKVAFKALRGALGKEVDDPAVKALLAKAGKVTVKPDYIVAKEAGFAFSIDRPEDAKRGAKKQLTCLFLYAEGRDKHRGFIDLPAGFTFTARADLLAALPAPKQTWKIGKGKVPVTTKNPDHDQWSIEGYDITVDYRDGAARGMQVTLAKDANAGRDLSNNPLHFGTKPTDARADAGLVGMALLVAWSTDRFGLAKKHQGSEPGTQLAKRAITPTAFLVAACDSKLNTNDVAPDLENFLYGYTHRMWMSADDGARDTIDAKIHALLRLDAADKQEDERAYADDFLGTFSDLESPFYVPDSWQAVDRIAPVLDARWADFAETAFEKSPNIKLYVKAAELRDAVEIKPERVKLVAGTADDELAKDLVSCMGAPLTDKGVRAFLGRAGLEISKRVEPQANATLGVSYMAVNQKFNGRAKLVVDTVRFYGPKRRAYIRGTDLEFLAYPGALPNKLAFGMARAAVAKLLGEPESYEENDHFTMSKTLRIMCTFAGNKLVEVYYGKPLK